MHHIMEFARVGVAGADRSNDFCTKPFLIQHNYYILLGLHFNGANPAQLNDPV